MKVNKISNDTSFGRLKLSVDKDVLRSGRVERELSKIRKIFQDSGFSRKKNVNVILTYDKNERSFFGIIESKKQGIPNNPNYRHSVSSKKKDVDNFGKWLSEWNYMYSPKGLKEWAEIKRRAVEHMQKQYHIVSFWKV